MSESYANAMGWASREVAAGRLPSSVLGVATSAGVQALEAFPGGGRRPVRADDHFALFSVTKPLVGIAALRVVERGELDLLAPLRDAVPGFGAWRDDTVRLDHLLTHTAGIVEPRLDPDQPLRTVLAGSGAAFRAGSTSQYSSIAFEGIAALVEMATNETLEAHVARATAAAGAAGLTFDDGVDPVPVVNVDEFIDYERFQRLRHPGAGMYGRASDLLNVGMCLLRVAGGGDGVVRHSTLRAMTTPRTVGLPRLEPYPWDEGQDWGLAWNLRHHAPGLIERDVFGHSGMSGCEWWLYPGLDLVFVLMTNVVASYFRGVRIDSLHNAVVADRQR